MSTTYCSLLAVNSRACAKVCGARLTIHIYRCPSAIISGCVLPELPENQRQLDYVERRSYAHHGPVERVHINRHHANLHRDAGGVVRMAEEVKLHTPVDIPLTLDLTEVAAHPACTDGTLHNHVVRASNRARARASTPLLIHDVVADTNSDQSYWRTRTQKFRLNCVIRHHGDTSSAGHYTCLVREGEEWSVADDQVSDV